MRVVVLALLAALVVSVPAHASLGRWGLTPSGDPSLWASPPHFLGPGRPEWRICPPNEACRSLGTDHRVEPGETAPGTIFESDFIDQRGVRSERSPAWQGRVTLVSPPGIDGDLRVGGGARATPAVWSGGWGDEFSSAFVYACPAIGRTDCELLDPVYASTARPLLERHAGWYVYAVESRRARDRDPFIIEDPVPAGPSPLPTARPLVAISAPAGPVAGLPETTTVTIVEQGRPNVTLRRRALRRGARVTVAQLTCPVRCTVGLSVSDGKRTIRRTLKVRGTAPLSIVRGSRLRAGLLRVRVSVDGRELASGRVRLR